MNKDLEKVFDIFKQSHGISDIDKKNISNSLEFISDEINRRDKDLEIEASLESVRVVAMRMKNPDELLGICEILHAELIKLGFTDLRNSQIVILREDQDSFLNYQYSDYGVTGLFEIFSKGHPTIIDFVSRLRKAKNSFLTYEMSGTELEEWKAFRIKNGELTDPKLDEASSLFYYWYSIDSGALGISTFKSITIEQLKILQKFRNVFDLAYQRYVDVSLAEAQAKEARIETSLERVRARSMAMHKSDELVDASSVLFNELKILGIDAIRTGVATIDPTNEKIEIWSSQFVDKSNIKILGKVSKNVHPFFEGYYNSWKNNDPFFIYKFSGEEVREYYKKMSSILSYPVLKEFNLSEVFSLFFFPEGSLNVITIKPLTERECNLLQRFARVFGLIYRRFLDLKNAEAQTREAQIELSLERVRARTMAMFRSEELAETAFILFQQFKELDQSPEQVTIGIINEETRTMELWLTSYGNQLNQITTVSIDEPTVLNKIYKAWKEQKKSVVIDISGKDLEEYNKYKNSVRSDSVKSDDKEDRRVINAVFFSKGMITLSAPEPRPEEVHRLLLRFAGVFELTYTRFLDLKQAEAQAKEALIEVALERVRSRTLAMHSSEELAETAAVVFRQLISLGIEPNRLYISILNGENGTGEFWITDEDGSKVSSKFSTNMTQNISFKKMYEGWKEKKISITIDMKGKELEEYFAHLTRLNVPFKDGLSQIRRIQNIAYFSQGFIGIASPVPQPEETVQLLERFASVFNLTYTRFNDLQQAEQQTHKARIEVALERVRARALAMQQPEELIDVSQVLRHEMGLLGVEELETCSIYIYGENGNKSECWYALKDFHESGKKLVADHFILDLNDTWVGREMLRFNNSGELQISIVMKGDQRKEWIQKCEELSMPLKGYYGEAIPDRTYHLYKFSNGAIGAATPGEISDESWDLLKRAASVFSLAYSRFKDLTKSRFDLQQLKEEKKRSDSLLLNILPEEIANELKQFGKSYARKHEQVSILFADIKGFSTIAENLSANDLVTQLDECFRAFDNIVEKHGLEKIKTVGDAYVCACGLPKPVNDNAIKAVGAAIDMINFLKGFSISKKIQDLPAFEFRVGIHTGPVVTGVVGLKKFTYDIWGDAVNMAARMEQHGEPGKINVSGATYQLIKEKYKCIHRGKIEAKNKGEIDMYFVEN